MIIVRWEERERVEEVKNLEGLFRQSQVSMLWWVRNNTGSASFTHLLSHNMPTDIVRIPAVLQLGWILMKLHLYFQAASSWEGESLKAEDKCMSQDTEPHLEPHTSLWWHQPAGADREGTGALSVGPWSLRTLTLPGRLQAKLRQRWVLHIFIHRSFFLTYACHWICKHELP